MYAVFKVAGKQIKAREDDIVEVPSLRAEIGAQIDVEDVLCVGADGDVRVGKPRVEGARVSVKVLEHGLGAKVKVFRMKRKKDFRRKIGHRQGFTRIQVEKISV